MYPIRLLHSGLSVQCLVSHTMDLSTAHPALLAYWGVWMKWLSMTTNILVTCILVMIWVPIPHCKKFGVDSTPNTVFVENHKWPSTIFFHLIADEWCISALTTCCRISTVPKLAIVSQASGSTWESSKSCYGPHRKPLWSSIWVLSWPDQADSPTKLHTLTTTKGESMCSAAEMRMHALIH